MTPSVGLRLRALLALSVFSISLSLPLLSFGHFTFDDDRACEGVSLAALASQARLQVGPQRPTLPPDHCALCHWLRAVGRSRTTAAVTAQAWFEPVSTTVEAATVWRATLVITERPSRAPPLSIG